ncbi:O-antigen ligase family protein [Ramlibacter sp.]|uniref:O-antigen ligase family protein n=1 Tax=Ramlibacter sp. TaxID=1917967 RepID=UPI002FC6D6B3
MRRRLAAWLGRPELLLGAWLNSFMAAMIVGHSKQPGLLFAALVLGSLLGVVLAWGRPARYRIGPIATLGWMVMLAAILAGYAANLGLYQAQFIVANVTSMLLALATAYLLATRCDLDWRLLLACHSLVALTLIPIPILEGALVWGRLTGSDLHPNYLGMISMLTFIGALGIRSRLLRWPILMIAAWVMVAVSSRASMLAAGVAVFTLFLCRLAGTGANTPQPVSRTIQVSLALLSGCSVLMALWLLDVPWLMRIADELFKLNDPYRGITTGASGRTELWSAALALWNAQPLLGVGFKGHAFLMPQSMPAHSAYIGMLAETGVAGTAGYLMLCAACVAGLWRRRRDRTRQTSIALVASYLVYGLVESRAVGFGNPYSILFLWIAFDAARRPLAEFAPATDPHASSPLPLRSPGTTP